MIEELGPYRIERQLGRGGMGTVYAGVHKETGQRAAIKALSFTHAEDSNFRQRFISEIETLKQLRHPNIVQLYGDGEYDGHLFYVMELVEGKTLQEELQAGYRFNWQEVTQIAIEICQALKHAHDHGIIHRDLKPANLLRAPGGPLKLSDFGIAKLFGATHLTAAGSVVGTADYMAPEQAEGRAVSNRSDLYSLGSVLFTLLARRPPFAAGSLPQLIHKLRYEEPPSVRRFEPSVPAELEQIIHQLLQKDPQARIPTALVLANRLKAMQHALAGGAVSKQSEVPSGPSPYEQATRVSHPRQGPATELSPTAVEPRPVPRPAAPEPWNEATKMTSPQEPAPAAATPAREDTVVEPQVRQNRFSTVEEERTERERAERSFWTTSLPIGLIIVALAGLVAAVIWGLQPPTADQLHQQIATIAETGDLRDAKGAIDQFLERYSSDPRAAAVRDWQLDVESQYLFSRLRTRARREALSDLQQTYVEAMKTQEQEPATARQLFLDVLHKYPDADDVADPITCREAARHQLQRLDARLPPSSER